MKLCYVDETGTDGKSPAVVMVGIIADVARIHRTRSEFQAIYKRLQGLPDGTIRELKSTELYRGRKRWDGVDGELRHEAISDFCEWLRERKHDIALAALDYERFEGSPLQEHGLDRWGAAALHIALQVQRAHQGKKKNKGSTFLVFDENKQKTDALAQLLYDPPAWSDAYYERSVKKEALDQVIDTAFYAQSHHVGLVQVADLFAFLFRRYSELSDYGHREDFEGEHEKVSGWVKILSSRLLPAAHRWPKKPRNDPSKWYVDLAPTSLRTIG